ncbi:uncharacterized protein LOC115313914 isoform X1 [Ixodes scapularis]|uniref:uncharacterized protein LOC115313914 isoform X1 n=2 Tax=Ixodes scapularis TaxID=6945 RepID=UPI001C385947|nr:uncharacterized protein LOC115313914 isoform X1 [Ixodes scapularis]
MDRPFAIVKFPLEDDCVAVVPVIWLSEDRSTCMWPENGRANGKGVLALAEQRALPGETGWEPHPVVVMTTYRTYRKASRKINTAEHTSALDTSDASAGESCSNRKDVPRPRLEIPPAPSSSSPSRERTAIHKPHSQPQKVKKGPSAEAMCNPCSQPQKEKERASGEAAARNSRFHSQKENWDVEGACHEDREEDVVASRVQLRLLHLLLEVRQQNRDILNELSQLKEVCEGHHDRLGLLEAPAAQAAPAPESGARPVTLPRLPATTLEELMAAEEAAQDEAVAEALQKRLFRIGGKTDVETVANIMSHIMSPPVQALYSLHGKKGKRKFLLLQLCTVATATISAKIKKDEKASQAIIGRWLPGSGDRGGGRKRRFLMTVGEDPSQELLPPMSPAQGGL